MKLVDRIKNLDNDAKVAIYTPTSLRALVDYRSRDWGDLWRLKWNKAN